MFWILTGILIVGIIIIRLAMWYTRPRVYCPHCDSDKIIVVRKEPLDMRVHQYHSGLQGETFIQTHYRVDYRCNKCHTTWTKEINETS